MVLLSACAHTHVRLELKLINNDAIQVRIGRAIIYANNSTGAESPSVDQ